jgi:hypothetical protein
MTSYLTDQAMREVEQNQKENQDYAPWSKSDTLNRAANESRNERDLRTRLTALREDSSSSYYGTSEREMNEDISRIERVRKEMTPEAFRQMTSLGAIGGGTEYEDAAEAMESIARATQNNPSATNAMVAQARNAAMAAGRIDQGGAGHGPTLGVIRRMQADLREHGEVLPETMTWANQQIHRGALETQGPGSLVHPSMKARAVEQLIPGIRQRLQTAVSSGSQDAIDREMAIISSVYEDLSRTSPDKARIFGDQIMRWDPETNQQMLTPGVTGPQPLNMRATIQERIEESRSSPVFQTTKREYRSELGASRPGGGDPAGDDPGAGPGGGPGP